MAFMNLAKCENEAVLHPTPYEEKALAILPFPGPQHLTPEQGKGIDKTSKTSIRNDVDSHDRPARSLAGCASQQPHSYIKSSKKNPFPHIITSSQIKSFKVLFSPRPHNNVLPPTRSRTPYFLTLQILLRQRIQHRLRHGLDFIPVLLARLDHLAQILLLLRLVAAVPIAVGSAAVAVIASVPIPSVVLIVPIVVVPS